MAKKQPAGLDLSDLGAQPLDLSDLGAVPATGGAAAAGIDGPMPVEPPPEPPAAPVEKPSQTASYLRGVSQGLTSNFGDELLGRFAAAFPSLDVTPEQLLQRLAARAVGTFPPADTIGRPGTVNEKVQQYRNLNAASAAANPGAYHTGAVTGGVVQAASPVGQATILGRPGVAAGVGSGVLAGVGGSETSDLAGLATDATIGGLGGGVASTAGPVVGRALGRAMSGVADAVGAGRGIVHPSPAAQALQERGVEDLTLGQLDPRSVFAQFEGTGEAAGIFGPWVQTLRGRGMDSWRDAVMREGLPPGMQGPPAGMPPQQQQARAYEGFREAYDAFRDIPVPPYVAEEVPGRLHPSGRPLTRVVNVEDGLKRAANTPAVATTASEREAAERFLSDQATRLPPEAFEPGGRVRFSVLQDMRSAIRDEIRANSTGAAPNTDRARLLQAAEDYLTQVMEGGLSPEQRAALNATDQRYASHKTLEATLARAGDRPESFTPAQLSSAIQSRTDQGGWARGTGGGPLRDLSAPALEVFRQPERTGWSTIAQLPWWLGGPVATSGVTAAANTIPALRRAALGQTQAQAAIRDLTTPEAAQRLTGFVAPELLKAEGRSRSGEPSKPPVESLRRIAANPQTMGKFGPQLAQAAAQGDDALITAHFMLSNLEPEYQRLYRAAQGAPTP